MDELEELKKRRLMELQREQEEQSLENAQLQQQVQQLEAAVKSVMTREALERLGNIKAANPEKALQAMVIMAQLVQAGQVEVVDDALLKSILQKITPKKREINIKRK